MNNDQTPPVSNFIRNIVINDLESGKHDKIITRFPPEPNGHLHIGHAKSICLNFGIAAEFGGTTNLRFDDTNPLKESEDFAQAIMNDVRWLGFEWNELRHASDYFEQLYEYAVHLVKTGKAYVDSQDAESMRSSRGTLTDAGTNSPFRDRPAEENLDLFERMKNGEFADGTHVLRARIDMASTNMNMRDPAIYRIRKVAHHRTGDVWNIYPMYDWAHGISDAIEGITHSLCTLEFEDHRPLYDWFLENIPVECHPRQIEFARGNLDFTVMSKRKLRELVEEGHVSDWDDPRMPTIAGLRRRGYTAQSIRTFWKEAGVAKAESIIPMGVLENAVRNDMNENAPRVMAVLDPIKVVLTNYPQGESEWLEAPSHPQKPEMGSRLVPLGREIWIERDDFMEDPPRKFFRLRPGGEVRLRNAFIIKSTDVIKDAGGKIMMVSSWNSTALPPRQLVKYYQDVEKTMGGPEQTRDFARLFSVPGSSGCPAFANPTGFKTFEALQAWVEEGKAPERIIYPHVKGGGMMGMGGGEVYRTRPVCPYPKQARYKGTGDINDAANFECVDPGN